MAIRTVGLVAIWLMFLAAFIGISALMSRMAGGSRAPLEVARRFALTLVPIAIGYHVAHYLVFLLVQGQYIVPLLSDPFGFGWNLSARADIASTSVSWGRVSPGTRPWPRSSPVT